MNPPDPHSGYHSDQAGVMSDYKHSGVFRKPEDAGTLHLFFSPNRVPAGLIDCEIEVCLALAPLVETWREKCLKRRQKHYDETLHQELFDILEKHGYTRFQATGILAATERPGLPIELSLSPMTRESFQLGVQKLIEVLQKSP